MQASSWQVHFMIFREKNEKMEKELCGENT